MWNLSIKYEQVEKVFLIYFWLLGIWFKSSKLTESPVWFWHNTNKQVSRTEVKDDCWSKTIPEAWEMAQR